MSRRSQNELTPPPGYELRAATAADISAIGDFIVDYDLEVGGYSDFTAEDLREMNRRKSIFDFETGTWMVTTHGTIAAFALVWTVEPNTLLHGLGVVGRAHTGRGLGTLLIGLTEKRASAELEKARDDGTVTLRNAVDVKDQEGSKLLADSGYEVVRHHYTMRTMLEGVEAPQPVPGITIRTCDTSDARLLHRLKHETFAGHWGHSPTSYEEWIEAALTRADTDPSMWLVAEDHGEPIGFLLSSVEGDRGWVSDIGVLHARRRRGVGAALLTTALVDFKARGLREAGLEVDAGNETGAVSVYERAGMETVRVYETFEKRFVRDLPG